MGFISQVINGLGLGSIYALVALGYSMVYGIVQLINFAHGDIIMVGAYAMFLLLTLAGAPLWAAVLGSILFCVVAGVLIELFDYSRLINMKAPRISLLITAICVSIFLQNLSQLLFTSSGRTIPSMFDLGTLEAGSLQVPSGSIINILTSVAMMVGLSFLVNKTKIGKAMRATSEDADAARLMGINTNHSIAFTFGLGSGLAAVGAVLYCNTYPMITPYMGGLLGLKAFVAAVLGGLGSSPGAMLGGYVLGVAESLTKGYISSSFTDAVVFDILILVLLVRPAGLLGRNVSEKV